MSLKQHVGHSSFSQQVSGLIFGKVCPQGLQKRSVAPYSSFTP